MIPSGARRFRAAFFGAVALLRPPKDLLARVRWFFLLAAFFNAGLALVLIEASEADFVAAALGILASLYLCWRWTRGYLRERFSISSDFLAGVALILVGYGAGDPIRCAMLVYMGLFLQALFGNRRRVTIAAAFQLGAFAVAFALSPTLKTLTLWSPEVLLQPPGVAMIAIMYVLGSTLARHERAGARERALARAGAAFVASNNHDNVYAAALEAVTAVTAPHVASAIPFLAFGEDGRFKVIGAAGVSGPIAEKLRGMVLDLDQLPWARERLMQRQLYELKPGATADSAAALGFTSRGAIVLAMPLFFGDELCGVLAVITSTSLPDECKDSLRALANEVALALGNLTLREELAHQAFHDPLTHLANRALLTDRLQHALSRAARSEASIALLLLDVDGFKAVNDSLGHVAGDKVLSEVAARLRSCLRESDTAARLGGDEFAVLIEELDIDDERGSTDAVDAARGIARRILDSLSTPIYLASTEVFVSASIGVAIGSVADSVEELLGQADTAMYAAKRSGKSRVNVFEPQLRADVIRRLELESDLRRAVEAGQFGLQYQPIVNLRTGRYVALEALLRWEHPRLGAIPPEQFVALAEETGQVVALGRWVLAEACRQVRSWRQIFPQHAHLAVNVNVAARQLREPGFVDDVMAALAESGLSPDGLVLELTETAFIHRSDDVLARLERLRSLGVHLSLDDFGTGYSSLAYLRDLPFDSVKIDRSFVEGIERNATQAALIRAIVSLSSALRLKTVAEGVETAAQAKRLIRLGCDLGQGFYFARASEAADLAHMLAVAATPRAA